MCGLNAFKLALEQRWQQWTKYRMQTSILSIEMGNRRWFVAHSADAIPPDLNRTSNVTVAFDVACVRASCVSDIVRLRTFGRFFETSLMLYFLVLRFQGIGRRGMTAPLLIPHEKRRALRLFLARLHWQNVQAIRGFKSSRVLLHFPTFFVICTVGRRRARNLYQTQGGHVRVFFR